MKHHRFLVGSALLLALSALPLAAFVPPDAGHTDLGPFNLRILEGGIGLSQPVPESAAMLTGNGAMSMSGWIRLSRQNHGTTIVAAVGDISSLESWRGIMLVDAKPALNLPSVGSPGHSVRIADAALAIDRWYAMASTYDGVGGHLFIDGVEVLAMQVSGPRVAPVLNLAPATATGHFGGYLVQFSVWQNVLPRREILARASNPPDLSLIALNTVGAGWPLQEHAWRGLLQPQDPWTLPKSNSAPSNPRMQPVTQVAPLENSAEGTWRIGTWEMTYAAGMRGGGEEVSSNLADSSPWLKAVVPGTVLSTLIAAGIYPDPDYGLNNLYIPESLNRQSYWYRARFQTPAHHAGEAFTLTFNGINYAAEVWLNGHHLGSVKGAFKRGVFDASSALKQNGTNVIAVNVMPPPHAGIPHEQSIAAGPGGNGGAMALDGPTFIATEGWDWIPAVRDRDTGIWQDVELHRSRGLLFLDPHVVTKLPLPKTDEAEITVTVPVENRSGHTQTATLLLTIDAVTAQQKVTLPIGVTELTLNSSNIRALRIKQPRLWWPNGYGAPNLYGLRLELRHHGQVSDVRELNFGVRELTYELSLFDRSGRLRRVEVDPTLATPTGTRIIDVRHEAIIRTPQGWAQSLTPAGESSPAQHAIDTEALTPFLVIRVNGVAIAARGGSWGMDDSRKRISRSHLEPYFELQREAHLNIIRNWLGQDTEEVFYDLADHYGLLVLNDFWISTQDYQLEPQDPALFLANAEDVIKRYRNHPSIAVWFGRNEGVPQPIINEGLDKLVGDLDGTRLYTGSSNSVNLQGSGPYNYRPPEDYFTSLAQGFSVEVGTPSLATLESIKSSIPTADQWPLSDTYAYHDWHFGGNGDVATFMAAMDKQFGAADSLEDFERKAQLMNYVSYRAIFEGFQAHLWTRNSGRLLWMSHPAWPSNAWQIYSSDYDAGAAYYAVKKACEPIHAQLNLSDFSLAVVNTTRFALPALTLKAQIRSLDNRLLYERNEVVDAAANATTTLSPLGVRSLLESQSIVFVKLQLTDRANKILSDSIYWQGRDLQSLRVLDHLRTVNLEMTAHKTPTPKGEVTTVVLTNGGESVALSAKINVLNDHNERVLPAYYSDNYVSLLPGESTTISVLCPSDKDLCTKLSLRGWNIQEKLIPLASTRD